MLTAAPAVDGVGLRVSLTRLAALKGVSKQAISKRAGRLADEGLIELTRKGRELTVSLAEWDTVTEETTDPAKLVGRDTAAAARGEALDEEIGKALGGAANPKGDPTYTQELTRKAGYEADLKEIEIRRRRGELMETAQVQVAMERCAEAIVRDIDQIPTFAEDLVAAVGAGGVAAVRDVLKGKARELRDRLARSMNLLAGADDLEEGEDLAA
ncbi:MAG: hypothetical protein VW338_00785 [Rhodospirillaceae bacterium]